MFVDEKFHIIPHGFLLHQILFILWIVSAIGKADVSIQTIPSKTIQLSTSCVAGTYVLSGNCVSCPAGTYSSSGDATACTPCASTLQSYIGATVCSASPVFGNINLFAGILQYTDKTPSGDNGPATSARIGNPKSLALDSVRQKLYISDNYNNHIRQVDLSTNVITTVLALSTYSMTSSFGRISVDGNANLYFIISSTNQVRHPTSIQSSITSPLTKLFVQCMSYRH